MLKPVGSCRGSPSFVQILLSKDREVRGQSLKECVFVLRLARQASVLRERQDVFGAYMRSFQGSCAGGVKSRQVEFIRGHSPIGRCPGGFGEITDTGMIGGDPVSRDVKIENFVHVLHHHHISV